MGSLQDTASLRAQIAALQAELDSLRARYDTLLEAKNRAAERYKTDYKKWRDFKRWLFGDIGTDEHVKSSLRRGESDAYMKSSALGKRKQFEEFGPNVEHAMDDDDEAKGGQQESIRDVKVELACSTSVTVTPRKQRRKSHHGEALRTVALSQSPSGNKNPFLAARSGDRNNRSLDNYTDMTCQAEPAPPVPLTEPRKGRGRYAQVPSGMDTINSRFSIRKDKNDGVDFQFDAVVRGQEERKRMLASDCECCREYYEAVGPLPASRQPLWRTPTKQKRHCSLHASDKENIDEMEKHQQLISRHRHHWHRPKTPPGYWDIGFPDTQEVLDINRRAAEMHRRKLVVVETEAKSNNGRYVEHAPKIP